MATDYVFTGRVFPERACVNVPAIPLEFRSPNGQLSGTLAFSVSCSQIAVTVTTDQDDVELLTVKNTVEALARSFIDALGYLWGCGYDVELSAVVMNGSDHFVFGVGVRELENAKSERPVSFDDLVDHIGSTQHLARALSDLREAIRSPSDTAFFCYRAAESIMQHFRQDGQMKLEAWSRMREALLIDESWLRSMQELAEGPRHGEARDVRGDERALAMDHAWRVMDRFCVFLNRGDPLVSPEFDLLREKK